jgi:hypothetical protein
MNEPIVKEIASMLPETIVTSPATERVEGRSAVTRRSPAPLPIVAAILADAAADASRYAAHYDAGRGAE